MNSSNDRTYCTVNKTLYTVDSGEKEKGKTIVWVKLTPFVPNAYCSLVINKLSVIIQPMHAQGIGLQNTRYYSALGKPVPVYYIYE
jgi:hypothetical protein